jgi:hypothetical protein
MNGDLQRNSSVHLCLRKIVLTALTKTEAFSAQTRLHILSSARCQSLNIALPDIQPTPV